MSLAAEVASLREKIEAIERSRAPRNSRPTTLSFRPDHQLRADVLAAARAQGCSVHALLFGIVRAAVERGTTVLTDIPGQFHAHRKPDHFHDGKSPRIKDPAREAADRTYQQLLDGNAATLADRRSRNAQEPTEGKLSETVARPVVPNTVPKPSR